jgi:hypothetical protein
VLARSAAVENTNADPFHKREDSKQYP